VKSSLLDKPEEMEGKVIAESKNCQDFVIGSHQGNHAVCAVIKKTLVVFKWDTEKAKFTQQTVFHHHFFFLCCSV
jgi:hypothetical protein